MNFNHILWVPGLLRIDHCTLYQCQCVSFSLRFSSPLVFLFFSLPFLFLLSSIHSPFFFFPSSVSSSPLLLLFLLLPYAHNLSTTHHTSLCQGGSKKNTPGTRPRHHPQPTPNSTTLHSTIPNDILSLSLSFSHSTEHKAQQQQPPSSHPTHLHSLPSGDHLTLPSPPIVTHPLQRTFPYPFFA